MQNDAENSLNTIRQANPARPFVVAQLGQSLDGRIATPTGESRWINRDCALDHLHRLRAEVDAVVVGIGTVIADDPQLNVRCVPLHPGRTQPARIVIDPSARLQKSAKLLSRDGAAILAINATDCTAAAPCPAVRIERKDGSICPNRIVSALFARGFNKILIEGGALTVSKFIDAGSVDRLHLLVAPMLLGSGQTGLNLEPISELASALRPPTKVCVFADGDVLFDCDLAGARANLT